MKRFSRLYTELDQTNRTTEKVAALESYFREADPRDAAWALYFLCGRRLPRTVTSTALREWATAESGFPLWLVDECYETVGDLGETLALLLPENASSSTLPLLPLHQLVEQRLLPMQDGTDAQKRELLLRTWRELDARERYLWNKLLTGGFRVGVSQTLVVHALVLQLLAVGSRLPGAPAKCVARGAGRWCFWKTTWRRTSVRFVRRIW